MAEPKKPRTTISWENLPSKPLRLIAGELPLSDFIRFRLVCKAWKTVTKCYRPYIVASHGDNVYPPMLHSIRGLLALRFDESWKGVRFVGSSHGWLIASRSIPLDCFLLNMFTKVTIRLPKWDPFPGYPQVYLSSSPTSDDCIVLLIGENHPGFSFCQPGDTEWQVAACTYSLFSDNENKDFLSQAVSVGGRFYVLSHQGRLAVIDNVRQTRDLTLLTAEVVKPLKNATGYQQYLIESKGKILVVFLCFSIKVGSVPNVGLTDHVEVFRFDNHRSSWTRVYDLGGRIFCVGRSCCFSISAIKVGWEANLIYFTDRGRFMWARYDMEERSLKLEGEDGAWPWPISNECECTWLLPLFS